MVVDRPKFDHFTIADLRPGRRFSGEPTLGGPAGPTSRPSEGEDADIKAEWGASGRRDFARV